MPGERSAPLLLTRKLRSRPTIPGRTEGHLPLLPSGPGGVRWSPRRPRILGRLRRPVSPARWLAERVGFEPTVPFPVHTISSRAPSAARSPLHSTWGSARLPTAPRGEPALPHSPCSLGAASSGRPSLAVFSFRECSAPLHFVRGARRSPRLSSGGGAPAPAPWLLARGSLVRPPLARHVLLQGVLGSPPLRVGSLRSPIPMCGERGIRTPGTVPGTPDFESGAFDQLGQLSAGGCNRSSPRCQGPTARLRPERPRRFRSPAGRGRTPGGARPPPPP